MSSKRYWSESFSNYKQRENNLFKYVIGLIQIFAILFHKKTF